MKWIESPVKLDSFIDSDVLDLIFQHRGLVFGGALRDILLNRKPNDVDVFIPDNMLCFYDEIEKLGYSLYSENGGTLAIKNDQKFDIHEGELIKVYDFDVNLLCTHDGIHLYNRDNPTFDPQMIIDNIQAKIALPLEIYTDNGSIVFRLGKGVSEARIRKIIQRGFYIPISKGSIRSTYELPDFYDKMSFDSNLIKELHRRLGNTYTVEDLQREIEEIPIIEKNNSWMDKIMDDFTSDEEDNVD